MRKLITAGGRRKAYRGHEHIKASVQFCEDWDQTFDPDYVTMPLEAFEPMVRRLLENPGNYAD